MGTQAESEAARVALLEVVERVGRHDSLEVGATRHRQALEGVDEARRVVHSACTTHTTHGDTRIPQTRDAGKIKKNNNFFLLQITGKFL